MLTHNQLFASFLQMPKAVSGAEPWFALDYVEAPLPAEMLEEWSGAAPASELALPAPNAFIASDFALMADAAGGSAGGKNGAAQANGDGTANGASDLQVGCLQPWPLHSATPAGGGGGGGGMSSFLGSGRRISKGEMLAATI